MLEDLGNIGEFVGSLAVFITLAYLAVQVRQNTNTIAGSMEMEIAKEVAAWHARITGDEDLRQLWEKGAVNGQMTESECGRYRWLISELFYLHEGAYRQYLRGIIPYASWEMVLASNLGLLKNDVAREWWESRMTPFSNAFRSHIDEQRSKDVQTVWRPHKVSGTRPDLPAP